MGANNGKPNSPLSTKSSAPQPGALDNFALQGAEHDLDEVIGMAFDPMQQGQDFGQRLIVDRFAISNA